MNTTEFEDDEAPMARRDEWSDEERDEERDDVIALLRSDECTALLCGDNARAAYAVELQQRLERGEHRR